MQKVETKWKQNYLLVSKIKSSDRFWESEVVKMYVKQFEEMDVSFGINGADCVYFWKCTGIIIKSVK